ncbi:MAG: hypothetical protein WBA93_14130, partial [Microcoleaceae cyanobacterium]
MTIYRHYGEKLGAGARTQVPIEEAPTLRTDDWKPKSFRQASLTGTKHKAMQRGLGEAVAPLGVSPS